MLKRTKIVATIGPKSESIDTLQKLFKAGVNVCRQNFSHGDFNEHKNRFYNIKKAAKKLSLENEIALLQDLAGPKIRTGDNKDSEYIELQEGREIVLTSKKVKNTDSILHIAYSKLASDVNIGDRILINDGKQSVKVIDKIDDYSLKAVVINGGEIRSRRGVNFPDSNISISSLTSKDKKDLEFGLKLGFDFIALSFVRSADDIRDLRKILNKHKSFAKIVAKIETPQAVQNFDEILDESDAIMVARGDLAIEIGPEKVPMVQKTIIRKANNAGKPVIVATQMLESMIVNPTPTRAEVSDIANAILDGADAVMLSEETAMGSYPVEAVQIMSTVAQDTEQQINYEKRVKRENAYKGEISKTDAVTRYAAKIALDLEAKAIVAFTETGTTPRMIARFRTKHPIFVISPQDHVLRQLNLSFSVFPGRRADLSKKRDVIKMARNLLIKKGIVKEGDKIVVVSGSIFGKPGETNTITVIDI